MKPPWGKRDARRTATSRPLDDLVAALACDENLIITHANLLACDLLGYRPDQLEGHDLNETLVPERSREAHRQLMVEYLKNPVPRPMGPDREVYIIRGSGEESRVWIGLAPAPGGQVIAAMITAIGPPKALNPPGHPPPEGAT